MSAAMQTDAPGRAPAVYQHRARPYAPESRFELMDDHVAIEQGRRSGAFPYREIALVRLMYKPRNTTNEGYQAKLYRYDRRTASLNNLSWKSLVEMERQDADYRRFVATLIERIARQNPSVVLMAGLPRWLFATTAAAGAAALGALAIVTFQAIRTGSWPVAGLTAALGAYLVWWSLRYLRRNRPRSFTPDAIPADVLPPAASAN